MTKKQKTLFKQQAWAQRDLLIHEGGNVFIPTLIDTAERVRRIEIELIELKERRDFIKEFTQKEIADYQGLRSFVDQLDWELIQDQANWREELKAKRIHVPANS